ncbi:Uncharacterized protein TCM_038290 [Theobroma cacao]|uniref:Uncharacterized protein n=1 Tax=Theobroma cacao TaxID=3641 RepID=A0A061GQA8_THECC|nr:Uncharacterized protein TCM_038290 [Theobroma cacao]
MNDPSSLLSTSTARPFSTKSLAFEQDPFLPTMLPNQSHIHRQQTNHPPLYAAPPYHHQFTPAPSTFFHHAPNSSFSNTQHLQPAPPQGNIFQQNYAIPTPRQTTQPSNQAFKYPPAHSYPEAINPPLKTTHRDWQSSLHSVYISNLSRRITRRLDGHYIIVKKAEYGWDQRRVRAQPSHTRRPSQANGSRQPTQSPSKYRTRPSSPRDDRTYLQVLQSSLQSQPPQPPQQQASFNIEVCQEEFEWLNRSAVGTLSSYVHHQILQEIFVEEGYQCVSKPMGGKNVLLTFCLKEDLKACTEEHRAWLNLREIGEQCGSFIMIDEDTYHRRRYDFARMLISVKKTTTIPTSVTFKANGGVYKVHVKEEDVQDIPKPHSFGEAPTTSHPLIQTKQHSDSGQRSIGWDLSEQQGSSRAACKTQSEHCTRTDSLREIVHLEPIKTRSSTTTAPPINLQNKSPTHASSLQSPPYHQLS